MLTGEAGPVVELLAALARQPATHTPGARRHFTDMIRERLGGHLDLPYEADRDSYLSVLVDTLARRPGGFAALWAVVSQLGPDPEDEAVIGKLLKLLDRPVE